MYITVFFGRHTLCCFELLNWYRCNIVAWFRAATLKNALHWTMCFVLCIDCQCQVDCTVHFVDSGCLVPSERFGERDTTTKEECWKKRESNTHTLMMHQNRRTCTWYRTTEIEIPNSGRVNVHNNSARMAISMQTEAETFSSNTLCIRRINAKKMSQQRERERDRTKKTTTTATNTHDQQAHERIAFNARDKNACVKKNKSLVAARFAVLLTIFSLLYSVVFDFIAIISVHSHFVAPFSVTNILSFRIVFLFLLHSPSWYFFFLSLHLSFGTFTSNHFIYENCERIPRFSVCKRIFMKYWSWLPIFASTRHVYFVKQWNLCRRIWLRTHSIKTVV